VTLGPNASQVVEVPSDGLWSGQSGSSGVFGAIVLSHDGPAGSLNPLGWIEDDSTGYSTMMTVWDPGQHHGTNLYTTQVFQGQQNNLFGNGQGLVIDSYLVLLNTSGTSISPQGQFTYDQGGQATQVPLSLGTLAGGQSVMVDLGAMQRNGLIPNNVSVGAISINYEGPEAADGTYLRHWR
jgi:hypothetical protein